MKKTFPTLALVLALLLTCIPVAIYAMDNIGATDTVQPVNSVIGQSVEAMNYSEAPDEFFPFIYSLAEEHTFVREKIIGPCDCTPGWLYVKNMTTGNITLIYGAEALHYSATQDELYYVTTNNTIMKTDFTGSSHTALYTASVPISELDYFEGKLCFLEGETVFTLYDPTSGNKLTFELPEAASSAFMFASDKVLWRNADWEPYGLDLTTGVSSRISTEIEVYNLVMLYLTPEEMVTVEGDSVMVAFTAPDIENDISIPYGDYVAEYKTIDDGVTKYYYRNAISYFTDTPTKSCVELGGCKPYASTYQCDAFARFIHEKYIHYTGGSAWSTPYQPTGCRNTTDSALSSVTAAKTFFNTLTTGAFVRYSNSSSDQTGFHSAVFVSRDANGVWMYEANFDQKCGVYLCYYNYRFFAENFPVVVNHVTHDFSNTPQSTSSTQHKTACGNSSCVGYIVASHKFTGPVSIISTTQHTVSCNSCAYCKTESHLFKSGTCLTCGYVSGATVPIQPSKAKKELLHYIYIKE